MRARMMIAYDSVLPPFVSLKSGAARLISISRWQGMGQGRGRRLAFDVQPALTVGELVRMAPAPRTGTANLFRKSAVPFSSLRPGSCMERDDSDADQPRSEGASAPRGRARLQGVAHIEL